MKFTKHKVKGIKNLSNSLFLLIVEKNGFIFNPGQHIELYVNENEPRLYSIASGINDNNLIFLIREIPNGNVSTHLKKLSKSDYLYLGKPSGFFTLRIDMIKIGRASCRERV